MNNKVFIYIDYIKSFYIKNINIILILLAISISLLNYVLHNVCNNFYSSLIVLLTLFIFVLHMIIIFNNLKTKAYTDALTGINNRMYFNYKMPQYLKNLKNAPFLFAMVDIDHFKQVNDNDGHIAGDILIREVSSILKNSFNKNAEIIRYGGDEFCVVLPNMDLEEGYFNFEEVRRLIDEKYNSNFNENYTYKYNYKYNYYITISIGLINIDEYMTIHKLIETADKCLYKAKENRNKVVVLEKNEK